MCPCYRHHCPAGNGLAEGIGPPHHGNPLGARSLELRVFSRHCGGNHNGPGACNVGCIVTPPYFHPLSCQIGRPRGV